MIRPFAIAPRRKRRLFRPRNLLLLGIGLMLAGAVGTWFWAANASTRHLRAAESEADRLDPGWRLADLLAKRAEVPFEENSAFQVSRARRLMPAGWPPAAKHPVTTNAAGETIGPDLVSQAEALPPNERLGMDLEAEIRSELERMSQALAEARKLAVMPKGRYDLQINPNVFMTLLDEQQGSRNVARLLRADAFLRVQDGDPDGAMRSCLATIRCGQAIGDEPFAISQLIRVASVSVAISTACRVMAQGEPSDASLAAFQAALEDESRHSYLLVSMRGERATIDDFFAKLTGREVAVGSLGFGAGLDAMAYVPMGSAFFRYNHALLLETMNEAVEASKKPDPELLAAWADWDARHKPSEGIFRKFFESLKSLLAPAHSAIALAHLRAHGQIAAAIAATAAERQRRATGEFPSSVAAIEPRFLSRPIFDSYDGRPVRFRATADGVAIYTVGPDLQDNGGTFDPRGRSVDGTDQGLVLFLPERRGLPSSQELPADVFQHQPDAPRAEDEPL